VEGESLGFEAGLVNLPSEEEIAEDEYFGESELLLTRWC